ncbi:xylulokinase [Amphritea pacifica]|uniref:FGGY-family carbohydrate kinase n=1 Tax=Amphritea pacifica TaxID=2811233 RepID=A0ABS2W7G5_9GAMM|nr:FGGY-family carbohydrate kinase [Amphritea pacifica]MBN0987644.1 FGGY-family carbohydrate kinase [Amphritea pacifica]MBN1009058.1 FGGY-family carbohydrate kinase [Amphritea pacifica]
MSHAYLHQGKPTSGPLVLAVDLGTSGCKCALVSFDGTVAAWAFEPVELYVDGVSAEQDPQDWWQAFISAASVVCADADMRKRIVTVCCSTQAECTVCVDRDGAPLGRAMLWLDMRGAQAIARRLRHRWFNVMGHSPGKLLRWLRLTGGVPAQSGKDNAGHIAYIRDHEPERYERTYKFLNALDYMNLRLTGRYCATPDSMLTTWVTDNRDPHRIRYDDSLLAMLGVERDKLPDIVPSTEVIGPALSDVIEQLRLPANTVVVAGAVDTSAVAIGAAVTDFKPHLYLGTSSWLGAHVPFKKTDVRHKIASVPCAVSGRYLAIALQSTAGANLSFLRDRILFHPDEFLSDEDQPDVYEILNIIAARVPPGSNGLIYMPWLFGERTPVDNANLRAGLVNLSLGHSREDIIRSFMEGVAFNTRWMMEPFIGLLGRDPGPIAAVGGGAQSDLWCQIIADVSGQPMRQLENPIQANTQGAAFLAAIGTGALSLSDLPDLQRHRKIYEPNPGLRALYDERFGIYKDLYRQLAPIYNRLNQSPQKGAVHVSK